MSPRREVLPQLLLRHAHLHPGGLVLPAIAPPVKADEPGSRQVLGWLTITPGANVFSGPVSAGSGRLTGSSQGRFYGPDAAELGGVGAVQAGSGVESIQFAYGAKKQ